MSLSKSSVKPKRASVLLLVLVAIVIMSLTTSTFLLLMRNEHLAARYGGNHLQADMLAQSGIDYLSAFLALTPEEVELQGGLISNPEMLQDVLVIDDDLASYRGRFTVIAPDQVQGYYQGVRYGLENESAKLNLNSLLISDSSSTTVEQTFTPRDRLMRLPGMTEETADAILDWMDENDSERSYGAESAAYQSLATPYQPRNGAIAHLDELLMVQGVTPQLLYGPDSNRNYQLQADEQLSSTTQELDNPNGHLNRGWSAYITVHSSESNAAVDGEAKIDVNADDLQSLHGQLLQALGPAEANFIIAFRQFGPAEAASSDEAVSAESIQIDFEQEASNEIGSLLDLVAAKVNAQAEESKPAQLIDSPWQDDPGVYRVALAELQDAVTTATGERTAGCININLASRPVLLTLPGMTEIIADQIIAQREPAVDRTNGEQRHPTWLVADGLIGLEEFKPMYPFLTTGGDVFSCQVVGFFDAGTARCRAEVVFDRSGDATKLLSWTDLSKLGPGFSRDVLSTFVELEQ